MIYAVISDIHSNLSAFHAVLAFLKDHHIDQIICLGDIVGYAASPNECVELVRTGGIKTVVGNHDAGAAGKLDISWFNDYAAAALLWTRRELTGTNRAFLGSLEYVHIQGAAVFSHACVSRPETFRYLISPSDALPDFQEMRAQGYRVCFVGHTHIPGIVMDTGTHTAVSREREITLEPSKRYIVNVGSVGQPRDGDPRACCGIYNDALHLVQLVRLEYDIGKEQEKIRRERLPLFLAERLSRGI